MGKRRALSEDVSNYESSLNSVGLAWN
ncbi:unnamed protein product [Amaranthus hypochondriacus]